MADPILQTLVEDSNLLIAIATFVIGIPTAIGLIITIRQNRETKYLQFIKDVDNELASQIEKEPKLTEYGDLIIYAYNYIDICDRVMFLIKKKVIPKNFFEYYHDFFNYAITMMWWYAITYPDDDHSLRSSWNTLTYWVAYESKESDAYPVTHLPKKMQEILPNDKKNTDKIKLCKEIKGNLQSIKKADSDSL